MKEDNLLWKRILLLARVKRWVLKNKIEKSLYKIYVLYRTYQIKKTNSYIRRFVEFPCSECGRILKPKELSEISQMDLSLILLKGVEIECKECGTINDIPDGERFEVKRCIPQDPLRFIKMHY